MGWGFLVVFERKRRRALSACFWGWYVLTNPQSILCSINFLLKWNNKNFLPPSRGALINVSEITYTYMLFLEVKHGLAKLMIHEMYQWCIFVFYLVKKSGTILPMLLFLVRDLLSIWQKLHGCKVLLFPYWCSLAVVLWPMQDTCMSAYQSPVSQQQEKLCRKELFTCIWPFVGFSIAFYEAKVGIWDM